MDYQPALPVPEADDELIERLYTEGPQTAEEYLLWVRLQAEDIGDVVRADVDTSQFSKNQSANYVPMSRESVKCDPDFLPAPSFVNRVLAEFADLRQYLCEMSAHGVGGKESNQRVPVPAMKDEEGWHQFCFGTSVPRIAGSASSAASEDGGDAGDGDGDGGEEEEAERGDDDGRSDDDHHDDHHDDDYDDHDRIEAVQSSGRGNLPAAPVKREFAKACSPRASLLLQFDQVLTRKLVVFHVGWLQSVPLSRSRAVWLYALFARLEKPIPTDLAATLRELYLRLCVLRAEAVQQLQSEPDQSTASTDLACVNVMLVIVGRYFEQEELDDREQFEAAEENSDQFVL